MPNTKSGEDWCAHVTLARIYRDERDAAREEVTMLRGTMKAALAEITRLEDQDKAVAVRCAATLAERDATIERLWRQLNEATNTPDHNDPEFGFDKTAALSEPDECEVDRLNRAITRVLVLIAPETCMAAGRLGGDRYFCESDIRAALEEPS